MMHPADSTHVKSKLKMSTLSKIYSYAPGKITFTTVENCLSGVDRTSQDEASIRFENVIIRHRFRH